MTFNQVLLWLRSRSAISVAVLIIIAFCVLYYHAANTPGKIAVFEIPTWIAGNSNTSYSIAIGESQIHRYGTLWKITVYPWGLINMPEK